MELKNIIFLTFFIAATALFIWSMSNKYKNMLVAKKKDDRFDRVGERLKRVWVIAFAQTKLLRDPKAGILHLVIFWGFILFIFAVVEAIVQGFYSPFSLAFTGPLFSAITIIQDVFGLLVILAVIYALWRRFVVHIPRLEVDKRGKIDAAVILLLIMGVCVSMLGQNISLVALNDFQTHQYEIRPVSSALAPVFFSSGVNANVPYEIFWWLHIIIVFGFLNLLPYSKHFHVITSIPNTYFARLFPVRNTIQPLNLEDESTEVFGAPDIEYLSWKQLLDGYTCTECGRCSAACPANTVGKRLSPRKIIVDIRRRTEDKAALIREGKTEGGVFEKNFSA